MGVKSNCQKLLVTKQPLYKYFTLWAEESSATTAGSAEWSFGNGATGFMGLPVGEGWELVSMFFNADTFAANAEIRVELMNYLNPSNAAGNAIAGIDVIGASDGFGTTNNAAKIVSFATPIPITGPAILGFITRQETGNISDARVGAELRQRDGEYVSDVSLVGC